MKKICLNIIATIACLLTIFGIIGFLIGVVVSFGRSYRIIPDSFEMPLSGLKGIAVDSEGNIYCGVQFYSRIQVYDNNGIFLYGKCFDSSGGAFKLKISNNDQLEVMTYRGQRKYLFDKNGTLLYKIKNLSTYKVGFEQVDNFYYNDKKQGLTYQIKPILFPSKILSHSTLIAPFGSHLVKTDTSGKEVVIIKTTFYKWLFMGPFPSILFIFIGFPIYNIILNKKIKIKLLFWTVYDNGQK